MWRKLTAVGCGMSAVAWLSTTMGCGTSLFSSVEVPATPQYVLDHVADFIADADNPLETTDPGTAIDALDALDGCWGTVFTEADVESQLSLFSVYQFDADAMTYVSWTFIGQRDTGELWSLMPIISEESGTYEATGEATIEMTTTRLRVNTADDGATILATLQEVSLDGAIITRSGLITIDGDEMLFFVDAETAADVDEADERPIYIRFDCPE